MYKSRFRLWMVILIFWLIVTYWGSGIIGAIKELADKPSKITFYTDNANIRRNLNNSTINSIRFIYTNKNDTDVIIFADNIDVNEEYVVKSFYSPLVAITRSTYADTSFFVDISSTNHSVRLADLKAICNGFLNDEAWGESYPFGYSDSSIKKKTIEVCVDSRYEYEIKNLLYAHLAGTPYLTEDIIANYYETVELIWEKAEKVEDVVLFMENNKSNTSRAFILITPEYNLKINNSSYTPLTFQRTVLCRFNIAVKQDLVQYIEKDKFMERIGLRNAEYEGIYSSNMFYHSDWLIDEITPLDADLINSFSSVAENHPNNDVLDNTLESGSENQTCDIDSDKNDSSLNEDDERPLDENETLEDDITSEDDNVSIEETNESEDISPGIGSFLLFGLLLIFGLIIFILWIS